MRVIGVYNIKGGVGKTSTAVNLAHLAAESGLRVLIWDLDPQAATTYYFRVQAKVRGGSKKMVRGKSELGDLIKGSDYPNLDLLPADFSYRKLDLLLDDSKHPTSQLSRLLDPLGCEFDLVILDSPPSISLLSENIFHVAEALLIPTIPTTLSLRTLEQLYDFLHKQQLQSLQRLPFFSMADRRKTMHQEMMQQLPRKYPEFLTSWIPYASDIERMGIHREPVTAFGRNTLAGRAYQRLWEEVIGRLRLRVKG